jgi:hypothetical protein
VLGTPLREVRRADLRRAVGGCQMCLERALTRIPACGTTHNHDTLPGRLCDEVSRPPKTGEAPSIVPLCGFADSLR